MIDISKINVSDIVDAFTVIGEKGRITPIDKRPLYGLSFCMYGKIIYNHNGREFISDRSCAIIIPKNATYRLYHNEDGEYPLINFLCDGHDFTDEFVCIPIRSPDEYLYEYGKLLDILLNNPSRPKSLSVFYRILDRLTQEKTDAPSDNMKLKHVIEYINSNFTNCELDSKALAKVYGSSEAYLRRIFAKEYNTSPMQYVMEKRVDYAKRLLLQSNKSYKDILFDCGFPNPNSFFSFFKKYTGSTPEKFRTDRRSVGI